MSVPPNYYIFLFTPLQQIASVQFLYLLSTNISGIYIVFPPFFTALTYWKFCFFIHLFLLQFPPSARLIFRPNVTTSDSQLTHNLLFVLILQKKDPNNSDNVRIRKSSHGALEHPELFKRKCFMSRKSHAGFHDENIQTKQYEADS